MKRELVVFSVIGGLLWVATGFSVLAVAIFDQDRRTSMLGSVAAVGESDPVQVRAEVRSSDEVTSAPLCETSPSEPATPRLGTDRDLRSVDVRAADGDVECGWDREALKLLQLCLLLT